MKLYGHEDSGHAYKVALALTLSEIPYEYERVDIWAPCETRPLEFQKNSRWCEVPLLMVDDQALTQSGAILIYLADKFGIFGGKATLARANEWVIWEANRIGMCLPQLVQARKTPEDFEKPVIDWLNARLDIDQSRLNQALEQQIFLTGEKPSIADIAIFGYISMAKLNGIKFPPNIETWIERIENLPHFQTANSLLA